MRIHKISNPGIQSIRRDLLVFFTLFFMSIGFANAQAKLSPYETDKAFMQINSGFYTVVTYARVDLDSSLFVASKRYKKSRIPVITENIENEVKDCGWMDTENADSAVRILPGLKGTNHTRLCLLLGAYYVFHPGFDKKYTDLAIKYSLIAKRESDQLRLNNFSLHAACVLGKAYFKQNNIPEGRKWFDMVTGNKNITDKRILAKAWNFEGMYCPFIPTTVIFRIDCLNRALDFFVQLKDAGNQMNTLMNIGYLSYAAGKAENAMTAAKRSLALQKSVHFPYQQYTNDLCEVITNLGSNIPLQLRYSLAADSVAEVYKDTLELAHFYLNTAGVYKNERSFYESTIWSEKAISTFKKYGGDFDLWRALSTLIEMDFEKKEASDYIELIKETWKKYPPATIMESQVAYLALSYCYHQLKQYATSQKYILLAKDLDRQNPLLKGGVESVYLDFYLGSNYQMLNHIDSAKKYLSEVIASPLTPKSLLLECYQGMYQADSSLNSFRSAASYLRAYTSLLKKLTTEAETKQVYDLNIRYETLKKEKNLEALTHQNALQKQQDRFARKLFWAGIILLLCITIMIYIRYYSNRKRNTSLQAQKNEIDDQNKALQQMNNQQEKLIGEKEFLLREIHHRVKNNMQTVIGLLSSQAAYLKDEIAIKTVTESQHRIQAMSLIHQKLYKTENVSSIYMPEYIYELVEYLKESFQTGKNIYFELQVDEIYLDVLHAVPLGLILNEIVTNAIKYAFPNGDDDKIIIQLSRQGKDDISFIVSDNGRGMPQDFDINQLKSFGMLLIKGLVSELHASFELQNVNGTSVGITFSTAQY